MAHHEKLFSFLASYIELTDAEKQALIKLEIFKEFKKGTYLLKEGERSKQSYFVLKGLIRVYQIVDYAEVTTALYTEMQSYAPPSTVSGDPSLEFAQVGEDSILLTSTQEIEEKIFREFPRFESLCRVFSEKLMAQKQLDFEAFRLTSPQQRYEQIFSLRPDLLQRVPQYQIASYIGVKPESLSRIRNRMAKKNRSDAA